MNISRDTAIKSTGDMAEKLVYDYLIETQNYDKVKFSSDEFDMHKDLIAVKDNCDSKVEVKARTVIRKYFAVPLEQSQWYKVDNADLTYFVTNPTSLDEKIRIFKSTGDGKDFYVEEEFGPRRARTRFYQLDKMECVRIIADQAIIRKFFDLSVSSYKNFDKPVSKVENSFELELPNLQSHCSDTISMIFSRYYPEKAKEWMKSGLPLKIVDNGRAICTIAPYDELASFSNGRFKNIMHQFGSLWFPTLVFSKNNLLELYDIRFAQCEKGNIQVKIPA